MPKCSVEWCDSVKIYLKGMCRKHYTQFWRYGKVFKFYYNSNVINEIGNGLLEVEMKNRKTGCIVRTIIDEDFRWVVEKHRFYYHEGYARTDIYGVKKSLHQFILRSDEQVDHINRDRLDNRKSNLRICTPQQNSMNKSKRSDNVSGIIGVTQHREGGAWKVYINISKKQIWGGSFLNKTDAIAARLKLEEKYFGEFAPQLTK